jgi:hypothetical protein
MTRLTNSQLRAIAPQIASGEVPVVPAPKVRRKRDNQEFRIQCAFVKLWRGNCARLGIAQCLGFHVPNGSVMGGGNAEWQKKERGIRGRLQKLAGVEEGVADWLLLVPSGRWSGMIIEFKKPGGPASEAQDRFIGFATARGYRCEIHTDADVAWQAVLQYLNP